MTTRVVIPADIEFEHLNVRRGPDATMEDLLQETGLEDERGQNTSHRPGRA